MAGQNDINGFEVIDAIIVSDELLEQRIIDAIKAHHDKTGGVCGLTFRQLTQDLNRSFTELEPTLVRLRSQKVFHLREGLNDRLMFYGSKKK